MLVIFLDTETTGLDPGVHRPLEIAFKVREAGTKELLASYSTLIYQPPAVRQAANPNSSAIHGISWDEVEGGKSEKRVGQEILELLQGLLIAKQGGFFLCQNPSFDRAFFNQLIAPELQQSERLPYHWLDLASMYWVYSLIEHAHPVSREEDLSKDRIAAALKLPRERTPHRALDGVNHLIACYDALIERLSIPQFREAREQI